MFDALEFDFTEAELYGALRLVTSDAEARQQAHALAREFTAGMDWAASEQTLMLLSLASERAYTRVEQIRRQEQNGRRATEIFRQRDSGRGPSADELARRWAELIAAENREWEARRTALRRSLQGRGKLPPDSML